RRLWNAKVEQHLGGKGSVLSNVVEHRSHLNMWLSALRLHTCQHSPRVLDIWCTRLVALVIVSKLSQPYTIGQGHAHNYSLNGVMVNETITAKLNSRFAMC